MAIAFDAVSSVNLFFTTPGTFSYTTSGSNRVLILAIEGDNAGDNIGAVSYGGTAMTLVQKKLFGGGRWAYLYILANPASGSNTVSVANTGAANGYRVAAISYTGAAQTGQPDNSGQPTGVSSTTFAPALTTVADNSWLLVFTQQDNGGTITVTTGTERIGSAAFDQYNLTDSGGPKTPAGSYAFGLSSGSSATWSSLIVSFAPVGSAAAPLPFRSLLGVGI